MNRVINNKHESDDMCLIRGVDDKLPYTKYYQTAFICS